MIFLIKAIQFLLSLGIIVILHELGHFIPAKLFKTKVEKFYLFFDYPFALFKKKIGETEYGIGAIPLGGYVKIAGMIDESMDTEHLDKEPEPWEYRSKPAWQRLIIISGGVVVNLILGYAIYMMAAFVWGKTILTNDNLPGGFEVSELIQPYGFKDGDKILQVDGEDLENVIDINKFLFLRDVSVVRVQHYDGTRENISVPEDIGTIMFTNGVMRPFTPLVQPIIDSIIPNSPAENAGLKSGDKIVRVNGNEIIKWQDFSELVKVNTSSNINIEIERKNEMISNIIPLNKENKIGVTVLLPKIVPTKVEYSLFESFSEGYNVAYFTLTDYVGQFSYLFTQKGITQLGGFGTIGSLYPATWNWQAFWETTALISIILAFMNALPIPVLDGGHAMFLFYEMLTGRKPNDKIVGYAQMFGFLLLIALVLYANGMDVVRWLY
ncbi:MAG: RIP metalloprotease RseP [Flavobacteriaceae bacterium]|jgi:regulator of sigma E protease|nr:RIP metalloprotease RseP [Flavobacteriaceae bacterium]MBT6169190.1 RIP metalloprotease RseP [Flavobacteriaceae bacterium]